MRMSVDLDGDVLRAVEALRLDRGLGLSEAVNELARRGIAAGPANDPVFVQATSGMGPAMAPLDDVGMALELLEAPDRG